MENIEKTLNEELRNNDCIENLVNKIDSQKSIYDAFIVDGKLVIVFNDELETNEVEKMQTMLKSMDGCGEVFSDEFELGYKGNFKSLTLDLLTDNVSIGKFEQGGEMEDYYDGQGDEGYGNTFEELRSQIVLGVMEDLRIPRETAQKVVDEKKEVLTDLIENHRETNIYSLVQKAQEEDDSYARHMETRKRLRNDEDEYPKGFNQFAKGGEVAKYKNFEMVVISKELNKDGGRNFKDRMLVSATNVKEAKKIATKLWKERINDESDLMMLDVLTDSELRQSKKYAKGGEVNKKNSIEWLFNHMGNEAAGYITEMDSGEALDYAKQMHKQEIIDAWKNAETQLHTEQAANKFAERYYNETFLGAKREYAKGGEIHTMSKKDKERFNALQKKDNQDKLTKVENVEYENLLEQYKKTKEYKDYFMTDKFAKDGDISQGGMYSIELDTNNIDDEFEKYLKSNSISYKVISRAKGTSYSQDDSIKYVGKKEALMSMIDDYFAGTQQDSIEAYKEIKKMAKGGEVKKIPTTTQVKRNLRGSGAFTLELEMAVYVPSTTVADQIISKTLFQKRIQEVEKYLSKLFGGYSSNAVEGGYVSQEKGLIKEDVAKVTAFGTEDAIKKNFKPLMRQISKWCESWGQESMGFEFEGDLYYVSKDAKFSKGGKIENKPVKPKFVKNAKK